MTLEPGSGCLSPLPPPSLPTHTLPTAATDCAAPHGHPHTHTHTHTHARTHTPTRSLYFGFPRKRKGKKFVSLVETETPEVLLTVPPPPPPPGYPGTPRLISWGSEGLSNKLVVIILFVHTAKAYGWLEIRQGMFLLSTKEGVLIYEGQPSSTHGRWRDLTHFLTALTLWDSFLGRRPAGRSNLLLTDLSDETRGRMKNFLLSQGFPFCFSQKKAELDMVKTFLLLHSLLRLKWGIKTCW